jgi:MATE family multidrug resistance protein
MLPYTYGRILRVALPMMLSGFIQSIISITDAAFLGHYDKLAFDAAGSAGLWYITLHMVFIGLSDGAQIRMANHIGDNDNRGFTAVFHTNFLLLFIAATFLTVFIYVGMPQIMRALVHDEQLAAAEQSFLEIRSLAFWGTTIGLTVQAAYLAMGKTKIVLFANIAVALINVLLAYPMIYGKFGFQENGLEGAAWANTIAELSGVCFLLLSLLFGKFMRVFDIWKQLQISWFQIRDNLKVGLPLLFQGLVALSIWTIFFIWIEQMGNDDLTVSLNIRHIYFLAFVPIWGFAATTKTYIAQYVGANQFEAIPIIKRRIQILTISFLVLTFHGSVLYPEQLISLVSENQSHITESARILRIVSGSILIYGAVMVYFQAISGLGKTTATFMVECIATSLYLLAAYLLIKQWKAPIHLVWLVEYVYFIAMGGFSLLYLWYYKKKNHVKI